MPKSTQNLSEWCPGVPREAARETVTHRNGTGEHPAAEFSDIFLENGCPWSPCWSPGVPAGGPQICVLTGKWTCGIPKSVREWFQHHVNLHFGRCFSEKSLMLGIIFQDVFLGICLCFCWCHLILCCFFFCWFLLISFVFLWFPFICFLLPFLYPFVSLQKCFFRSDVPIWWNVG